MMKISPTFRRFLWLFALLNGLNGVRSALFSLFYPQVYRKDLVSGYLVAKALGHGVDPYLPLSELAVRFNLNSPAPIFPHPTPHTVAYGILMLPFSLLPYEKAAVAWMCFELICLAVFVWLMLRWLGRAPGLVISALLGVALLGWGPVMTDLLFGQLNLPLLCCLTCAWWWLRQQRDAPGGALLGLAIALKMMGWPIALFLLWQRRWRAAFSAAGVFLGLHAVAAALIGVAGLADYYLHKAPAVAKIYSHFYSNYSVWSLCLRWFEGTKQSIYPSLIAPPLLDFGSNARWLAVGGLLLVLGGSLYLAQRARYFDTAFSVLLCASLLVNPIAWDHYLVLMLLPLAVTLRRWLEHDGATGPLLVTVLSAVLFSLPSPVYRGYAVLFHTAVVPEENYVIPWAATLLTSLPTLLLLGWLWWIYRAERAVAVEQASVPATLEPQPVS
ncbi:MAG: DUF2029 domain-containing protein [Acidobacteria bacterium]|nr:DUF2029 domain-containing protein [Acidobacteriota bacterium]MBI3423981.1 DUF2029 domain-containing protein [Acidobacteriota bacterium]